MSRRYNRKQIILNVTSNAVRRICNDPAFILANFVKPKPKLIPELLWALMVKTVVKLPTKI